MNECSSRSAALSVIFKLLSVTSLWFEPRAKLGVPSVVVVFLKSSMIFEGKSIFHVVYLSSPNHSIFFVTASSYTHLYYVLPVHSFGLLLLMWMWMCHFLLHP